MLSISYVLSMFLRATILNESVTLMKIIGVAVIMIGVVFVAGGDSD